MGVSHEGRPPLGLVHGDVRAAYRVALLRWLVLASVLAAVGGGLLVYVVAGDGSNGALVVALVLLGFVAIAAPGPVRARRAKVLVYDDGLVYVDRHGSRFEIPWWAIRGCDVAWTTPPTTADGRPRGFGIALGIFGIARHPQRFEIRHEAGRLRVSAWIDGHAEVHRTIEEHCVPTSG